MTDDVLVEVHLNAYEARQLFHGMEFAIRDFRRLRHEGILRFMSSEEIEAREAKMIKLCDKMERVANQFPENN